jgi:Domain of unknown function (DUF4406)
MAQEGSRQRVYIAGPYSGGDTARNVYNAIEALDRVEQSGFTGYCPHLTHFLHLVEPRPYQDWLAHDRVWLAYCDALLRLPGKSSGADLEASLARKIGIPVFTSLDEMRAAGKHGFTPQQPQVNAAPDPLDWPRVYIATPKGSDIAVDVRNGIAMWHRLADAGFSGYLPLLTHFLDLTHPRPKSERDAYNQQWYEVCDAVITLPGNDPEVKAVVDQAARRGIPVARTVPQLARQLGRAMQPQSSTGPLALPPRGAGLRTQRAVLREAITTIATAQNTEFAALVADATLKRLDVLGAQEDAQSSVYRLTLMSVLQGVAGGSRLETLRGVARKGLHAATAVSPTFDGRGL